MRNIICKIDREGKKSSFTRIVEIDIHTNVKIK